MQMSNETNRQGWWVRLACCRRQQFLAYCSGLPPCRQGPVSPSPSQTVKAQGSHQGAQGSPSGKGRMRSPAQSCHGCRRSFVHWILPRCPRCCHCCRHHFQAQQLLSVPVSRCTALPALPCIHRRQPQLQQAADSRQPMVVNEAAGATAVVLLLPAC